MELNQFFNLPLAICSFLSRNISIYLIIPSLLYHIFVYIYLGIKSGGSDFYYGFMYSFNYAGAIVAYWIILYQSKNVFNNSNILSKELLDNQNSETDETIETIEINQAECKICCFSRCDCSYKSTYFQLMKNNMNELANFDKSDSFYSKISKGGILILDNFNPSGSGYTFPGEIKAVKEFIKNKKIDIKRFDYRTTPCYIIKK